MIELEKNLMRSLLNKYLNCLKNTDSIVDAVNARYSKNEITLEMIKDAFDENGMLKKPVAEFIGEKNVDRIKGYAAINIRYANLREQDLFLLDSIDFEVGAMVHDLAIKDPANNNIETISDLKKSMTESDLDQYQTDIKSTHLNGLEDNDLARTIIDFYFKSNLKKAQSVIDPTSGKHIFSFNGEQIKFEHEPFWKLDDLYTQLDDTHKKSANNEFAELLNEWEDKESDKLPFKQLRDLQLRSIESKAIQLENSGELVAARVAKTLHNTIKINYDKFDKDEISFDEFKKNCNAAIDIARPELQKHRGWSQVLHELVIIIANSVTFGAASAISILSTSKLWFLNSPVTDSHKKLDTLKSQLDELKSPKSETDSDLGPSTPKK